MESEAKLPEEEAKLGSGDWAFMRRRFIGRPGDVYLDRLTLFSTPWFSVKLHRIIRPDNQRELHDHPWSFLSIVLFGWYIEDTWNGVKVRRWLNWKRAEDAHSIKWLSRSPVWTLVFCGPRRRDWGFWVDPVECTCYGYEEGHMPGCAFYGMTRGEKKHASQPQWIQWEKYTKDA